MDAAPRSPLSINANVLLRDVSRSFYLTLRLLPGPVRHPISLAYLLARASDTIADTEIIPVAERLVMLRALRRRLAGENVAVDASRYESQQGTAGERTLLLHLPELLTKLDQSAPVDRGHIRKVTETITGGQELDLERFQEAGPERIVALSNAEELHDYTYRVAGCVGEFWTQLCRLHLFPKAAVDVPKLLSNGVRFGQGLQLVNILRDLPADLRTGRCYLPADELRQAGLEPSDLLDSSNEGRLRKVYDPWVRTAREHLQAGWAYTNGLPWGLFRVRLACAWPILIGFETIQKLERENVLEASRRIKTSRREVRSLMVRSVLACPWPRAWRNLVRP